MERSRLAGGGDIDSPRFAGGMTAKMQLRLIETDHRDGVAFSGLSDLKTRRLYLNMMP
jgi:hypothetical protein